MLVETKKENLCINQIVGQREETVYVEGDIIIPDIKPDILNAMDTSGNVCIYKKDILDGKVRMDGSVNLYIMYLPDGENDKVRGLNTSLDFTEVIDVDEARSEMTSCEEISIKEIECRVLNGRKINLRVKLEIKIKIFSNENVNLIKQIDDIQDIQTLSKTTQIYSLVGEGSNKIYAKDKLPIDEIDNLAEILKADFSIINKEIKISYNKVLAKADLDVKILYLTEDNRINKVQAQIPIMGFVDIANVSDTNICDVKYSIKNILIKPNSVEEHGIFVEVQIELSCAVYETKEINIIQDLYSPKNELKCNQKIIKAMIEKQSKRDVCQINEKIKIFELGGNRIYDVDIKPIINSQKLFKDKVIYEGEIQLKILSEGENAISIESKTANLSFNYTMDMKGIDPKNSIDTNIEVKQSNFVAQGDGNLECQIQLEIETCISNTKEINAIDEINIEDTILAPSYSMVIYFVRSGDTLWKIAKKFKSTVEDIVKVNEIEDENKIYPGMQLFIPKYNCKKLA